MENKKPAAPLCYNCNINRCQDHKFRYENKPFCSFICLEKFITARIKKLCVKFQPNYTILRIRNELIEFGKFLNKLEKEFEEKKRQADGRAADLAEGNK
jgi:hypothetical protein